MKLNSDVDRIFKKINILHTLQTNEEAVVAAKLCHVFWTRRQSQTVSEYCQLLKTAREDFILHYGHFLKELIKVSVLHQTKTVHK